MYLEPEKYSGCLLDYPIRMLSEVLNPRLLCGRRHGMSTMDVMAYCSRHPIRGIEGVHHGLGRDMQHSL